MDNLFSKASSYLSSQADHQGALPNKEEHQNPASSGTYNQNPASSGGYGDLLAGAQSLMKGATQQDGTNKSASSADGYKDLLAGAQAILTGAGKPKPNDEGLEAHKSSSSAGGLSKPSGDVTSIDKEEDAHKTASAGGYGDLLANTQVLMNAAKASDEAEKAKVAGAAANLISAAAQYGNLEKTSYGEYANKAQAYLHNYEASHGKPAAKQGSAHQSPSVTEGKEEGPTLISEEGHKPPTFEQSPPYTGSYERE